jgi:hypothetical protein
VTDEQVVPLERKAVLQTNGFQVGQLSGLIPQEFQDLLRSERSCANPRLCIFHAGDAKTVVLGPTMPSCAFQVEREGEPETVELDQVQCTLVVVPTLTDDGRTRLRFTPQLKHGRPSLVFRPVSNGQDLTMQEQRPTETYPALSWEVTLRSNEYVLIGGHTDQPRTLGYQCFIHPEEANGVRRLLALRVGRSLPGLTPEAEPAIAAEPTAQRMPSLALQASMTAVRATSP